MIHRDSLAPVRNVRFKAGLAVLAGALTTSLMMVGIGLASGVSLAPTLAFGAVIALTTCAGAGLWILLAPGGTRPLPEVAGVGAFLGAVVLVAVDQGLRVLGLQSWTPAVIGAAALVGLAGVWARGTTIAVPTGRDFGFIVLAIVTAGGALVPIFRENLVGAGGVVQVNGDAPYREAISNSVHLLGPADSLLVADGTVRYHWLGNGWVGAVGDLTDAMPFVAQVRFLPIVVLVVGVLLAWSIAWRMRSSTWSSFGGALMAVLVGGTGMRLHDTGGFLTNSFGISVLFSAMGALACWAVWQAARDQGSLWGAGAALALAVAATSGARLTSGVVVVGSAVVAAVVTLVSRERNKARIVVLAVSTVIGLIAGFLLYFLVPKQFSGDEAQTWAVTFSQFFLGYQGLIPLQSSVGIGLAVVALLLGVTVPLMGVLGLAPPRDLLRTPDFAWGVGAGITGVAGLMMTYNFGLSHFTFLVPAMTPLLVLSGAGAGAVVQSWWSEGPHRARLRAVSLIAFGFVLGALAVGLGMSYGFRFDAVLRWMAPIVVAGGVVLAAVVVAITSKERGRSLLRPSIALVAAASALAVSFTAYSVRTVWRPLIGERPLTWSAADLNAGAWLREHVSLDEVTATNRQCNYPDEAPPECVSTAHDISALGSRRALIEGSFYSIGSADRSAWPRLGSQFADMELSVRFGDSPSRELAEALWQRGVRYLWIDSRFTERRSWAPFAEPVFEESHVVLLRLNEPS